LTVMGLLLVALSGARTTAAPPSNEAGGRFKHWMRSGVAIGLLSSAAYGVGNVMRGAAVREWNEPILGALLGALVGIGLHFVIGSGHAGVLRGLRTAHRGGVLMYAISGVLTISAQMVVISAMK